MAKNIKVNLPIKFDDTVEVKVGSSYYRQTYVTGQANFPGNGNTVTINHDLGTVPTAAYVTPISNPEGYVGEHWIELNSTNIVVGNSGSYTGLFKYVILK